MGKNFFTFKTIYFDDLDNKFRKTKGIVIGESMIEAIEKISDFFGKGNLERISIQYFNTDMEDILTEDDFPEIVEAAFEENYRDKI